MGASISPRDGGGGKRRRGHAKNRPMAEINVTPFVDVMLVLLIIFMVAAPEGIDRLQEAHPDVEIWVAAIDEKLNEVGYILPGLGDAGDKIFGTK